MVYFLFVCLFVLTGANYFYAPDVVLEADCDADFFPKISVYYTTNEYDGFSENNVCIGVGDAEKKVITAHLPVEKVKRIMLVPHDWSKRSSHGLYVQDPPREGRDSYTLTNLRLHDSAGQTISGEGILLVEGNKRKPTSFPRTISEKMEIGGVIYEVQKPIVFAKRFSLFSFVQVILASLVCAACIVGALYAEPGKRKSHVNSMIYALATAYAFSVQYVPDPLLVVMSNTPLLAAMREMGLGIHFYHLLIVIPFYLFYRKAGLVLQQKECSSKAVKALAVLLTLFIMIGCSYEVAGTYKFIVGFEWARNIKAAVSFFGYVVLAYTLLLFLFELMKKKGSRLYSDENKSADSFSSISIVEWYLNSLVHRPFVVTFCSLLILYLPFLILRYPCAMDTDGYMQALQIHAGESVYHTINQDIYDVTLKAHHPLAHTLLIIGLLQCGLGLGNAYVGLFMYSCLQLLIVTFSVSFSLWVLVRYAYLRAEYAAGIIAYFFLHPCLNDLMFYVTKDVLYSAALLCLLSLLFLVIRPGRIQQVSRGLKWSLYVLTVVAVMIASLFRHEGGIILIMASFMMLCLSVKLAKPILLVVGVTAASLCGLKFVSHELQVRPGPKIEMYSVPCLQLARALKEHAEVFTLEERDSIKKIFDGHDIAALYSTGCSDSVKAKFVQDEAGENLKTLFELWGKGLKRCPQTYVDAFLHSHYFYFFPNHSPVRSVGGQCALTMNLGYYLGNPPGDAYIAASSYYYSALLKIREAVCSLPILSIPLIMATYTWVVSVLLALAVRFRCKEGVTLLILPVCLILMPLLGPTNGDFARYTHPVITCLPFLMFAVIRLVIDTIQKDNG